MQCVGVVLFVDDEVCLVGGDVVDEVLCVVGLLFGCVDFYLFEVVVCVGQVYYFCFGVELFGQR